MIELKVKAKQEIIMDAGDRFMSNNIPSRKAMRVVPTGIICFTGYGFNEQQMIISREEKDAYGNRESLTFCMSGAWKDREHCSYDNLNETT